MADVRVDATIGDEAEQVKTAVGGLGVFHGFDNLGGLVEFVVLDGWVDRLGRESLRGERERTLVDLDNVLPDDSTGTNVQVSTPAAVSNPLIRIVPVPTLTRPPSYPSGLPLGQQPTHEPPTR